MSSQSENGIVNRAIHTNDVIVIANDVCKDPRISPTALVYLVNLVSVIGNVVPIPLTHVFNRFPKTPVYGSNALANARGSKDNFLRGVVGTLLQCVERDDQHESEDTEDGYTCYAIDKSMYQWCKPDFLDRIRGFLPPRCLFMNSDMHPTRQQYDAADPGHQYFLDLKKDTLSQDYQRDMEHHFETMEPDFETVVDKGTQYIIDFLTRKSPTALREWIDSMPSSVPNVPDPDNPFDICDIARSKILWLVYNESLIICDGRPFTYNVAVHALVNNSVFDLSTVLYKTRKDLP